MSHSSFCRFQVSAKQVAIRLFVATICIATALMLLPEVTLAQLGKTASWTAPTTNSDGTILTDLAGHKIGYGTVSHNYTTEIDVPSGVTTTITFPTANTYYVAVLAYDTSGNRSAWSTEISLTVTGSSDGDGDGVIDTLDCAPTDASKWRNQAYSDPDVDGIRNSVAASSVTCFGATAPAGYTIATNGPDNCPTISNSTQTNTDGDAQGDACDTDDDNDAVLDPSDCAPIDASKYRNQAFSDSDGDGVRSNATLVTVACFGATAPAGSTLNTNGPDNCPTVSNGTQINTDGDTQGDACDTDDDNDAVVDPSDCAPIDASKYRNQAFSDSDGDGVRSNATLLTVACFGTTAPAGSTLNTNGPDNCPTVSNANQVDTDHDGLGDVCDPSPTLSDSDGDGIPDGQDNCPIVANSDQLNTDSDGQGDACDSDDDNDLMVDSLDCAPVDPSKYQHLALADGDQDEVAESLSLIEAGCFGATSPAGFVLTSSLVDNCPNVANPDQLDSNANGVGDACDTKRRTQCSQSSSSSSALALLSSSGLNLVTPGADAGPPNSLASGEVIVLGSFDSSAPAFAGELNAARVTANAQGDLDWTLGQSTKSLSALGRVGAKPLGCYGDLDNNLDRAVYDKNTFSLMRSGDGTRLDIALKAFGATKDVECSDLDGDGIDELVVLSSKSPYAAKKRKTRAVRSTSRSRALPSGMFVTVFKLSNGSVLSSRGVNRNARALALGDCDGNGSMNLAYSIKSSAKVTVLACLVGRGEMRSTIKEPIKDLSSGRFTKFAPNQDGFAYINGKGQLKLIYPGQKKPVLLDAPTPGYRSFGRCR